MSLSADTMLSLTRSGFILLALLGSLAGVAGGLVLCFRVLNWISKGRTLPRSATALPVK